MHSTVEVKELTAVLLIHRLFTEISFPRTDLSQGETKMTYRKKQQSRKHRAYEKTWQNVTCVGAELPKLGPINRVSILTSLISNVGVKMKERYSSALNTYDVANILDESLNPAVKVNCEEGKFDLDRQVFSGIVVNLRFADKGFQPGKTWARARNICRWWDLSPHFVDGK